jgi:ubiquinone/menaquinone biosynthesis C-methylase UbiE
MKKGELSNLLRNFGLIYLFDKLRFYVQKFKFRKINRKFKMDYPDVKLPPDYLIYESFQMNYHKYYTESIAFAKLMSTYFAKHIELKDLNVLDWGCGPGRVIRHMPQMIAHNCEFYGTDYNANSIQWCKKNLPGIHFNHNSLEAVLPYEDNFFGVIYGHSIITHLSEELHYAWFKELRRVLKPGGILYLTAQGDNYKVKLSASELKQYNAGELVVRGKVKEGHRTYSAFQPNSFMKKLFADVKIVEHVVFKPNPGAGIPQDIWIVKK